MRRSLASMPWWCLGALALVTLSTVGSVTIVALKAHEAGVVRRTKAPPQLADGAVTDVPAPPNRWSDPAPLEGRHGELFTRPSLVYDDDARRFLPPPPTEILPLETDVLLELLGVEVEEYPLRLIGHVGSGASLRGIFARPVSGETVVAGAGHVFPGLGLAVQSLRLQRSQEGGRREAFAVIRDALSGEQVELRSGQPLVFGPARARVKLVAKNRILEVAEGALMELSGWAYRVLRVQGHPESVEIVPENAGAPAVVWREPRANAEK